MTDPTHEDAWSYPYTHTHMQCIAQQSVTNSNRPIKRDCYWDFGILTVTGRCFQLLTVIAQCPCEPISLEHERGINCLALKQHNQNQLEDCLTFLSRASHVQWHSFQQQYQEMHHLSWRLRIKGTFKSWAAAKAKWCGKIQSAFTRIKAEILKEPSMQNLHDGHFSHVCFGIWGDGDKEKG